MGRPANYYKKGLSAHPGIRKLQIQQEETDHLDGLILHFAAAVQVLYKGL